MARKPTANITILPSHRVIVQPFVPELADVLSRNVLTFRNAGPVGHVMEPKTVFPNSNRIRQVFRKDNGYRKVDGITMPLGRLSQVHDGLTGQEYRVTVLDQRTDSLTWTRCDDVFEQLDNHEQCFVKAVDTGRALGVVSADVDSTVAYIATLAKVYPEASIAIGVVSREQLLRIARRLERLIVEPLGRYSGTCRTDGRVAIGLIQQLPRGNRGEWDVLVFPFAEMLSAKSVEVALSGQYRRIVAFTRSGKVRDEGAKCRLEAITEGVWPIQAKRPPVSVVMLKTHGTRPSCHFVDHLDQKRKLYWANGRRNRRIAALAKQLNLAKHKSTLAVLEGADASLVKAVTMAAKSGVAVLAETPEHAHSLKALLPRWNLLTAGGEESEESKRSGVIVTELAAAERTLSNGVLIRATGTPWPLPELRWPSSTDSNVGFLIDFTDNYHPLAARHADRRKQAYASSGLILSLPTAKQSNEPKVSP
jgi:hypothetical protein